MKGEKNLLMSTREMAIDIVNALSEEQLQAFVTLFGSENIQAIMEANKIADDDSRPRYNSFEDVEKVIFADDEVPT